MYSEDLLRLKIQDIAEQMEKQTGLIFKAEEKLSFSELYQELELSINGNPISYRNLDQEGMAVIMARLTLIERLLELDLIKGVKQWTN